MAIGGSKYKLMGLRQVTTDNTTSNKGRNQNGNCLKHFETKENMTYRVNETKSPS